MRVLHVHTSMPASKQMTSVVYVAKGSGGELGFASFKRAIAKPVKLSNSSTTVWTSPSPSVATADWSIDYLGFLPPVDLHTETRSLKRNRDACQFLSWIMGTSGWLG